MAAVSGPRTVTPGLVLNLDAANVGKTAALTAVEVLVVAGGGGGSMAGGGAGGVIHTPAFAVSAGTAYTVTVGAGGAKTTSTRNLRGTDGAASSFSTITAIGGGAGGAYGDGGVAVRTGNPGGSGGGGGGLFTNQTDTAGGAGTAGQGNDGGRSQAVVNGLAGGGGGAGSAGVNGGSGGGGGTGMSSSISGTLTFYGGGGGGGAVFGAVGQGGLGGGGLGGRFSPESPAFDGTANTGGGGGGGTSSDGLNAGNGGSGIVVIRYPGPQRATGGTVTGVEGDTVHTFTSVGSSTFTPFPSFANGVAFTGVPDLSGLNNVGTAVNGPVYSTANGGAFVFDGVNDRISTNFKPSGPRSYFIWVKYNIINSLPNGFSLTGTQEINAYNYIGIQSGGAFYYFAGTSGGSIGSAILLANTWYQQGFVLFANGSRKLYLNGNEIASQTGGLGSTPIAEFSIGCVNNNHFINGLISQVSVYNRALAAVEIAQNFEAQRGRFGI